MKAIDGRIYVLEGRYDEAIAICKRNIDLDPTWGGDHDLIFQAYAAKGMYAEAVDAYTTGWTLLKIMTLKEMQDLKQAFAIGGWDGFLRQRLKILEERSKREYVRPDMIAEFYALLQKNDKAFEYLKRSFEKEPDRIGYLKYWPAYNNLKTDPRYSELLRRYDLAAS
jgi:tetratricopeptide (TPR) repeat protein